MTAILTFTLETLHSDVSAPRPVIRDVDFATDDVDELCGALVAAIQDFEHGHGLAAPQLDVPLKMFALRMRPRDAVRFVINPKLVTASGTTRDFREGCLSLPGYRGIVRRPNRVKLTCMNEHGRTMTLRAFGYEAAVIQHELDHLEGIWYWQKLLNDTSLNGKES